MQAVRENNHMKMCVCVCLYVCVCVCVCLCVCVCVKVLGLMSVAAATNTQGEHWHTGNKAPDTDSSISRGAKQVVVLMTAAMDSLSYSDTTRCNGRSQTRTGRAQPQGE